MELQHQYVINKENAPKDISGNSKPSALENNNIQGDI